jgi:hypothetical protein
MWTRQSVYLVALLLLPSLSGCMAQDEPQPSASDLVISPEFLSGAQFQSVEFSANMALSVHIPYLVIDPDSGFVTNGTTLHFDAKGTQSIQLLAPSNLGSAHFLVGDVGQHDWPLRSTNQSWVEWFNSSEFGSTYSYIEHPVFRSPRSGLSPDDGANQSTGLIDGYSVYEWMKMFTDANTGYNERWGPLIWRDPAYERALGFLRSEFASMGLDAQIHRYTASSSPFAVNVCGYKEGTLYPDEWLVLGAHLDIAEIGSGPGGGTHIGAHDNGAGVAMMLEAARGLAQFDHRRTLAVCFWSNEENGYDGADRWIDDLPSDVTVTNYLNIDSAGVNYPGDYTLVIDIIPDSDDELGEQWEMIHLTEWLGANNNDVAETLRNGRDLYYSEGYAGMKDHDHTHPNTISVHESQRGRSDYVRFAERLDVVSMDFGAITGGYDCYHAPCDTLDEMVDWMQNDNGSGQQNLVESFDLISWWVVNLFFHLDETPIYNED